MLAVKVPFFEGRRYMDIDVTMKIDRDAMMSKSEKSRTIAKGWVEVENCIKFPVFVRTYIDKETQEEKMFVSMPQRKGVKGYSSIISFENKEAREEIEDVVLKTVLKQAFKSFEKVSILETKITLLPEDTKNRQVKIKGITSIRLEGGIRIQSILIKEGKNGLFVEMPQYFSEGSYHDTVYGTSEAMRDELSGKILEAYKKQMELQLHPELAEKKTEEENLEAEQKRPEIPVEEVKREKQPENPDVPESGTEKELVSKQESKTVTEPENANEQNAAEEIKEEPVLSWDDRFVAVFAERNKEEVLALLAELRGAPGIISSEKTDDILIMEQAEYSINEKTSILLIFDNTYEKDREIKEGTDIRQEITVVLKEKDKKPGMLPVIKLSSHNLEDAEARYKEAVRSWQTLTHQNIAPDIEPVLNSQQQPAGEPKSEMKEEIEESIDEEPESAEEVKTVEETEQEKEQNVPESGTQQEINVAVDKEEVTGQKETGQTEVKEDVAIQEDAEEKMINEAAVKEFLSAYLSSDNESMLAAISHAKLTLGSKNFSRNYNTLAFQEVSFEDGKNKISVRFHNGYAPEQTAASVDSKRQLIEAVIYENGDAKAIRTLAEKKTISSKRAASNYDEMKSDWMQLTHQDTITFDPSIVIEKQKLKAPKM